MVELHILGRGMLVNQTKLDNHPTQIAGPRRVSFPAEIVLG